MEGEFEVATVRGQIRSVAFKPITEGEEGGRVRALSLRDAPPYSPRVRRRTDPFRTRNA
jgi:hypothetical protein